ncbi:hypothetical protein B296_00005344 [Ensete ventricosum]|uniref:Uncharacterized protein n=1 Tax=Ensete ventricosum TaxID=4639 RepID=A0A427A1B0_ENSVE|nr:hypothetical protein B296_00005344 [Ensete ventricosum]
MERGDVVKGVPVVQPADDLFWFNRPRLLLFLIHFVLFQVILQQHINAFLRTLSADAHQMLLFRFAECVSAGLLGVDLSSGIRRASITTLRTSSYGSHWGLSSAASPAPVFKSRLDEI